MSRLPKQSNKVYYSEVDIYKTFPDKDKVSLYDYKLISQTFFYLLMSSIIKDGKVYQLPFGLGTLSVRKRPVIGRGVFDYHLYQKEGIKLWKKNLHSEQFAATIFWDTRWPRYSINNAGHVFRFSATRHFNRELSHTIKQENTINKYYDY